jgi:hypothetical protein
MGMIEGSLRRVWTYAGVPTDGAAGTYVNQIQPGDLLVDTTNKTLYQNTNTSASPTYTLKASSGASLAVLAAEMAANGTGTANVLGASAAAAPIDHVHKIGTHDHSDDTKGGTGIVEAGLAAASLTGLVAKVMAEDNIIGAIPVIHAVAIAGGAAADKDVVLTHKTRILEVWAVHRGGGGEANDTIQVKNGANAITDAMAWSDSDTVIVRAASIDDSQYEIAAGGTLRVTTVDDDGGGDVGAGVVFVLGVRVG